MKLTDTTVLVTGASRGIGRELVTAFLNAGARKVYATARDSAKLAPVTALDPARITAVRLDVTDRDSVRNAALAAPDVTVLVNNAGVLDFGSILDVPEEKVARQFDTNFHGALAMARAFVPVIARNGGGAAVNILTLVALASMPGLAAYNASKAAAWSMTQSLRASLAAKGVEVYGVFPGAVDTDMLAGVEMPKANPRDVAAAVIAGIEAGREDIFPDPMSSQFYVSWRQDHKAVEKQFAAM